MFSKSVMGKASKSIKKIEGFSLVEVLVSIAILSIVSVSLLQTFTVSARTNRIANEMDAANALCIETAEMIKADPTVFIPSPYIKYYNGSFDRATASPTLTPGVSEYKVVVTSTAVTPLTSDAYYCPDPVFEVEKENVSDGTTKELQLIKSGDSDCLMDSYTRLPSGEIVFSDINKTAMVPILVDCTNVDTYLDINVTNQIGTLESPTGEDMTAIADIYIYNKKSGAVVKVVALEGSATYNEISVGEQQMASYTAAIEVIRLSDNKSLAHYNVDKYWVEEVTP